MINLLENELQPRDGWENFNRRTDDEHFIYLTVNLSLRQMWETECKNI